MTSTEPEKCGELSSTLTSSERCALLASRRERGTKLRRHPPRATNPRTGRPIYVLTWTPTVACPRSLVRRAHRSLLRDDGGLCYFCGFFPFAVVVLFLFAFFLSNSITVMSSLRRMTFFSRSKNHTGRLRCHLLETRGGGFNLESGGYGFKVAYAVECQRAYTFRVLRLRAWLLSTIVTWWFVPPRRPCLDSGSLEAVTRLFLHVICRTVK